MGRTYKFNVHEAYFQFLDRVFPKSEMTKNLQQPPSIPFRGHCGIFLGQPARFNTPSSHHPIMGNISTDPHGGLTEERSNRPPHEPKQKLLEQILERMTECIRNIDDMRQEVRQIKDACTQNVLEPSVQDVYAEGDPKHCRLLPILPTIEILQENLTDVTNQRVEVSKQKKPTVVAAYGNASFEIERIETLSCQGSYGSSSSMVDKADESNASTVIIGNDLQQRNLEVSSQSVSLLLTDAKVVQATTLAVKDGDSETSLYVSVKGQDHNVFSVPEIAALEDTKINEQFFEEVITIKESTASPFAVHNIRKGVG